MEVFYLVLVLEMIFYCEDIGVIGIEFYLMDYVFGMQIEYLVLQGVSFEDCYFLYKNMVIMLVVLYKVDINVVGLQDYVCSIVDYYVW